MSITSLIVMLLAPMPAAGARGAGGSKRRMGGACTKACHVAAEQEHHQSPSTNAFVTAHGHRCKPEEHENKPDCRIGKSEDSSFAFFWCPTTDEGEDYCTDDYLKTASGFTCKTKAVNIHPVHRFAWCFVNTEDDSLKWDYCRYPDAVSWKNKLFSAFVDADEFQAMYVNADQAKEIQRKKGLSEDDLAWENMMKEDESDQIVDIFAGDLTSQTGNEGQSFGHEEQQQFSQDYIDAMDGMMVQTTELDEQADIEQVGDLPWKTLEEAGWTKKDIDAAISQSKAEWKDPEFQDRLFHLIFKSGLKAGTSYNAKLNEFTRPVPEQLEEYLQEMKNSRAAEDLNFLSGQADLIPGKISAPDTVYFALGPSAAGKTSTLATMDEIRQLAYQLKIKDPDTPENYNIEFPAMTFDGADARDASEVWQRYAKDGGWWIDAAEPDADNGGREWVPADPSQGRVKMHLLKDYFDKVAKPLLKPNLKSLAWGWIDQWRPPTVFVPETAVPCVNPMVAKWCPALDLVGKFEKRGYNVKFLVIYAPSAIVKQSGKKRAMKEGKTYSSNGYIMALHSAKQLYKRYRNKYDFIFVHNAFEENELPKPITWKDFKQFTAFEALQDLYGRLE